MTIHHFRQLQELGLMVTLPLSIYRTIFPSITSIDLRKIVILMKRGSNWMFLRWMQSWVSNAVDEQLCELVDRLGGMGYRHTLEVELRSTLTEEDLSAIDFTELLPRFREKGVVTVIDVTRGDRVLHSSTHNR